MSELVAPKEAQHSTISEMFQGGYLTIYIFAFKYGQAARIALEQIQASVYAAQFLHWGKDVIILEINFSADIRNIADWEGLIYNAKGEALGSKAISS